MSSKTLALAVLSLNCSLCLGADWRSSIGQKLDVLSAQLSDGCSSEVRNARMLYEFGKGEGRLFAGLISLEGQHCGNANVEYLVVYRAGHTHPKDEDEVPSETYWLAALATIGGRGKRSVDFGTLTYSPWTFTVKARTYAYGKDPMCCPSVPTVLHYELTTLGLAEVQPNTSLERTRER